MQGLSGDAESFKALTRRSASCRLKPVLGHRSGIEHRERQVLEARFLGPEKRAKRTCLLLDLLMDTHALPILARQGHPVAASKGPENSAEYSIA